MANTKIIQTKYDNNANYLMDRFLECIIETGKSYPNDNSVINDPLRVQLQKLYGIKLSMFDTHSFRLGSYTGVCFEDIYFIYEAPIDIINRLVNDYTEYYFPEVNFPEGILLGFFPSEFKDIEFRKAHMIEYSKVVWNLYENLVAHMSYSHTLSSDVIDMYRELFKLNLFAQIIENGMNIPWTDEGGLFNTGCIFKDAKNKTNIVSDMSFQLGYSMTTDAVKSSVKQIQAAYRAYNYSEIGDLFRTYGYKHARMYWDDVNCFLKNSSKLNKENNDEASESEEAKSEE